MSLRVAEYGKWLAVLTSYTHLLSGKKPLLWALLAGISEEVYVRKKCPQNHLLTDEKCRVPEEAGC